MRRLLLALLLLCASSASANDWPTNVIDVVCSGGGANSSENSDCTGLRTPYEQCLTGSPTFTASPSLDGCDGVDIMLAIQRAQLVGGGIVRMPCASTFENAENTITAYTQDATDLNNGVNYNTGSFKGFPNGLIIEGCGATGPNATILKSKIPPAKTPTGWPSASIFYTSTWDRQSGTAGFQTALPKIWYRNFQCDGQSNIQPSYMHRTAGLAWGYANNTYAPNTYGAYNAMEDFHTCISNRNFWNESQIYGAIWITGIYAHHFVGGGFSPMMMSGNGLIAGNTIEHVGCWASFNTAMCGAGSGFNANCTSSGRASEALIADNTYDHASGVAAPCCSGPQTGTCQPFLCCGPGATQPYDGVSGHTCDTEWLNGTPVVGDIECGCDNPGAGSDCREWRIARESNNPQTRSPGFKKYGFSTYASGPGKILMQKNVVSQSAKYGLACASDWNPTVAAVQPTDMCRIDDNYMTQASVFAGTHGSIYWFSNNSAHGGIQGNLAQAAEAIGVNGMAYRIWISNNTVRNGSRGSGIRDWGFPSTFGQPEWFRVVANNVFEGGISQYAKDQNFLEAGPIVIHPALVGCGSAETPANSPQKTYLMNNTVFSGHFADVGLLVAPQLHDCPTYYQNPLIISGGSYGYSAWSGHTQLAKIRSALNINATGVQVIGPGTTANWQWLQGYADLGATGTCSGFVKTTGGNVQDLSTHGIGTCP